MDVHRRTVLASFATLLGGGCLAESEPDIVSEETSGSPSPATPTETPEMSSPMPTTPTGADRKTDRPQSPETDRPPSPSNYHPARTVETYRVGPSDNAPDHRHRIRVWNATDEDREAAVSLVAVDTDEAPVDDSLTLPADTDFVIEVFAPADYRFTLRIPELDVLRRLLVETGRIDCNHSVTSIVVSADDVRQQTFSTMMACPTASPAATPEPTPTPSTSTTPEN